MPEREKIIKGLEELCEYLFHEYKICYHGDEKDIYNRFLIADNALSLLKVQEDAPQKGTVIVRCAECRKWDGKSGLTARMCAEWRRFTTQHEFCSRGAKWDA